MDFLHIFDLIIGIYGLNFIYQWYRTKIQGKPFNPQCILATDMTLETCSDVKAFTAFTLPRVLGFGVALVAYAIISYSNILAGYYLYFYIAFFIVIVLLYLLINKQARMQFWR